MLSGFVWRRHRKAATPAAAEPIAPHSSKAPRPAGLTFGKRGSEVLLESVAVTYMVLRSTFGRTTGPLRFALPGARSDYPSR